MSISLTYISQHKIDLSLEKDKQVQTKKETVSLDVKGALDKKFVQEWVAAEEEKLLKSCSYYAQGGFASKLSVQTDNIMIQGNIGGMDTRGNGDGTTFSQTLPFGKKQKEQEGGQTFDL